MSVSSTSQSGTLSGSGPDLIHTGVNTQLAVVLLRNYSGSDALLTLYSDDTDPEDVRLETTLATKESIVWRRKMGAGNTLYAESDTVSAISWELELDTLS